MKPDRTRVQGLFLFVVFLFLFSCSSEVKQDVIAHPVAKNNSYASYFKIRKEDDCTVLTTYLNFEKSDSVVYALYRNEKPGVKADAYVKLPVTNVACLGSIFVGMVNRLQMPETIRAVDNIDFICNPSIRYLHAEGSIKELSKAGQLNIESTLNSGVEVLFVNPGGEKKRDLDERLLNAGIVPVICADYFETHPLGRAEWIKALALFFGKESAADSLFIDTEAKYLALKKSTDTCRLRPTAFTEMKTGDTWFVAGGKSSMSRFLSDAGADYLWKDNGKVNVTGLNMEEVIVKALGADYWINLHLSQSAADILKADTRYGQFKAFKTGNIYNNNAILSPKGANSYWEDGLCNPDEILADLVSIFHPNLHPGHRLKYYRKLQ